MLHQLCAELTWTAGCSAEEGSAGGADQSLLLGKAQECLRAQLSGGRGSRERGVPGSGPFQGSKRMEDMIIRQSKHVTDP